MKVNNILNMRHRAMKAHRSIAEQKLEEIQVIANDINKYIDSEFARSYAIAILDIINTQA